ncbi:hypothetical protein, partial [Escherichia coli]|uniref:hypothetical protein n=1 Tax=Escherichia coli TaxID=562 RepID=UPI0030C7628E
CSPMTSLKTSIKTITYLSDIGCLEIQGASLKNYGTLFMLKTLTINAITQYIDDNLEKESIKIGDAANLLI